MKLKRRVIGFRRAPVSRNMDENGHVRQKWEDNERLIDVLEWLFWNAE